MASYKIRFKKSVRKDFRKISGQDVKRILKRIEELSIDPRGDGCIKLAGKEYYRARVGSFRIVYQVRDAVLIVLVIKIAHRSNVYKQG